MKKSLWIVLSLSTLLAMFIIAGCQAVAPVTSPTVAPTTAPASACPSKTTVTTITELYSGWGSDLSAAGIALAANGTFKVNINFDKPISLRDLSTASWKIQVARYVLYDYLMVFGATTM